MKVSPYLIFNGNCIEAIELYEKAFKTKSDYCQFKDAPSEEYSNLSDAKNFVMHCVLPIGGTTIYLSDTTPDDPRTFGNGSCVCVELETADDVKAVFKILKDGGKVICEAENVFWNPCYAELTDKFGVRWLVMVEEQCTCTDECANGYNPNCTCTHSQCHCREKN